MPRCALQSNMKHLLLFVPLFATAAPQTLRAQQVDHPVAPSSAPPAQAAAPASQGADNDAESGETEIVVTGARAPRGATFGEAPPDVQVSQATIRALGINSISELLQELAPQIRSVQGRGGDPTIILLNGRRTSGFAEVRDLPAEAIARAEILPEEVALRYGYSSDQRVVNIILRKRFRAAIGEADDQFSTDGGRNTVGPTLSYLEIDQDRRVSLTLKYQHSDDLAESARHLGPFAPRRPYDLIGNITTPTGSGEIDPALSALAGQPVTIAGAPALAASRPLTLSDLVASAGRANLTDTTPFRTLLPTDERGSVNGAYSRNIFGDVAATLSGRLEASSDASRLGLSKLKLILPAGSPYSPFAGDVAVYRFASAAAPIHRRTKDLDGHLGLVLNGHGGAWLWSLAATYDRAVERSWTSGAVDPTAIQAALVARDPSVNPFGAFAGPLLAVKRPDTTRLTNDVGGVDLLVNGSPLRLPAGKVLTSLRLGANWSAVSGQSVRDIASQDTRASRRDVSGQLNIDVPVASRRNNVLPALGKLSLNGNLAVHHLSDFGWRTTVGYGLVWSPVEPLRIIISATNDEGAPALSLIGAPVQATPNALLFDYSRGETVEATRIRGGTAGLSGDVRHVLKIGATWKPEWARGLTLTANYVHAHTRDAVAQLAVTPALEAAYPSRFVRDPGGALVRFDDRPVNVSRNDRDDLRWGVNWSYAFGGEVQPHGAVPGQAKNPNRVTLALYDTWRLNHEVRLRGGLPALDLLNGDSMSMTGGDPRHEIEAQAGIARNGAGLRLSANWRAATTARGLPGVGRSSLTFARLTAANLRLFANLGQMPALAQAYPALDGVRLTLAVDNLFDARPRVADAFGATPYIYQPAFLDPLGREIRVDIRKSF
jgi:iron complex outermembrane recepter protein